MGITPQSLSTISLVSQGVGAITSAIGARSSAQTMQSNLNAQAGLADTNARISELGAQSARLQGQQQVAAATLRAGKLKSSQRVALAANGVDLGVGSAAEVQADTELMKEIDKDTLTANAIRNAWGYRSQAVNFQNEAIMKRAAAGSIKPGMAFASSLLGSAGGVAKNWFSMRDSRMQTTVSQPVGNVFDTEYY